MRTTDVLREGADDLIQRLQGTPDPDAPSIYINGTSFSVNELIQDLRELTPRGKEFAQMHIDANAKVVALRAESARREAAKRANAKLPPEVRRGLFFLAGMITLFIAAVMFIEKMR